MQVPDSLDDLVSTTEAANRVGVGKSAICNWVDRGYLTASGLDEQGHPLYRFIDVVRAASARQRRALRERQTA